MVFLIQRNFHKKKVKEDSRKSSKPAQDIGGKVKSTFLNCKGKKKSKTYGRVKAGRVQFV